MALFTRLEGRDFDAIAERLGLGAVTGWEGLEAGTVNSNYFLDTSGASGGRWFVRVNEGKSVADVEYEAELVNHLAARGVATPRVLAGAGGQPYLDHGGRLITVFPRVAGEHRMGASLAPADLAAVGRALALFHLAAADFPGRRDSIYAFDRIVARRRGIPAQPAGPLAAALAECDQEIAWQSEEAQARAVAALPQGVIHGDLFPDNVLFNNRGTLDASPPAGDELVALLDFEQASDGAPVYDLAVCLCAWCFVDGEPAPPLVQSLVGAYHAARPLHPVEEALFPVVARRAALRFTVTRITDVELNPEAAARREAKSYRRFLARLAALRRRGEAGFRELLGASLDH